MDSGEGTAPKMSRVTVFPDLYVRGYSGDGEVAPHPVITIEDALTTHYSTGAMFVPYYLVGDEPLEDCPRIKKDGIETLTAAGLQVCCDMIVVDVDPPKGADPITWRAEQKRLVSQFADGTFGGYDSRSGYHLLFPLREPVSPGGYEKLWLQLAAWLKERGVEADPATKDWTHLYRLPNVTRDGEQIRGEWDLATAWFDPSRLPHVAVQQKPAPRKFETGMIPDGKKYPAMLSFAGVLRGMGLREEEIYETLCIVERTRCQSPLEAGNLERIAKGIGAKPANYDVFNLDVVKVDWVFDTGSETEMACCLLHEFQASGPAVVFDRGDLFRYSDKGVWEVLPGGEITRKVCTFDGAAKMRGQIVVGSRYASGVYKLMSGMAERVGFFEAAPLSVVFRNGLLIYDKAGLELKSFDPEARAQHALPFDYDPEADCPRFKKVLHDAFSGDPDGEAKVRVIQEFFGACLFGAATRYQHALMLLGEGGNGKSVLLSALWSLFPESARAAIPPQKFGQDYFRAMLAGKTVNVITEMPEAELLASESFRALIDGSPIEARHPYKPPFSFTPTAGHVYAANNLPVVNDLSHGFWRRWIIVKFERIIPASERIAGLDREVIDQELPGVAQWCVEGARRLLSRGKYQIPSASKADLKAWRAATDPVTAFAFEILLPTLTKELKSSDVYLTMFLPWLVMNGIKKISQTKFSTRLRQLGFTIVRRMDGRWVQPSDLR